MAYIPNTDQDRQAMLEAIGLSSLDDLYAPIPEALRFTGELNIPSRYNQIALEKHYKTLGKKNASAEEYPCFLGAGIYDHYVPPTVGAIIGRSEFYTSYTPYQPEVSQGVLQSIFEFQTLTCELMGMDVANASMYDGATALAEAAIMACELTGRKHLLVPDTINPIYRDVLETYVRHMNLTIDTLVTENGLTSVESVKAAITPDTGAILLQQPNFFGAIEDVQAISAAAHEGGALFVTCVDPISLGLLTPPGDYDADIVVAEGQALGCPMGYGGPLLGLFACKTKYLRRIPGRIVGETKDGDGKRAFVMTLRTREQDIRRERATSNICTNVALYALAGAVYLATMGRQGLKQVAELSLQKAHYAATEIAKIPGYSLAFPDSPYFKEFVVETPGDADNLNEYLMSKGLIGGYALGKHYAGKKNAMLLCVTEQRTKAEIDALVAALLEYEGNS